jgi:hypothetical protein
MTDTLLLAEIHTIVERYERLAEKHDPNWKGWWPEMRDAVYCLQACLDKVEGQTYLAMTNDQLIEARREVGKMINEANVKLSEVKRRDWRLAREQRRRRALES